MVSVLAVNCCEKIATFHIPGVITLALYLHVHMQGTGIRRMIYDVCVTQRKRHIVGVAYDGSLQQ